MFPRRHRHARPESELSIPNTQGACEAIVAAYPIARARQSARPGLSTIATALALWLARAMTGPLTIIWHSRTGAARAMAEAAYAGAEGRALLLPAEQATPAQLLEAGAYLFVCPENLGALSGAMKELFDRAYYPLLGRIEGRAYATAIAAGSDGRGAQAQLDRIVTGWRLKRVAEPLIVNLGAQTPEAILAPKQVPAAELERCHALGAAMAEGLSLGLF
jgi:NAD(P)H-dependent FMN reductase